jgi:hypothetical protein
MKLAVSISFPSPYSTDTLIEAAGLAERPVDRSKPNGDKSHGTEDVYELDDPNWTNYDKASPARSARKLKENWDKVDSNPDKYPDDKKPILKRTENAESYAASALEWYFMQRCNWDTIDA